jgi:hypothetical protein
MIRNGALCLTEGAVDLRGGRDDCVRCQKTGPETVRYAEKEKEE